MLGAGEAGFPSPPKGEGAGEAGFLSLSMDTDDAGLGAPKEKLGAALVVEVEVSGWDVCLSNSEPWGFSPPKEKEG